MLLGSFVIAAVLTQLASAIAQQTTTIVVGFPSGANYDIHMRTFAHHLGKHLSGNPTIVPQNMAGAGSLRAANFLYNVAPKDGTTIGKFARGLATQPLAGSPGRPKHREKFSMKRAVLYLLSRFNRSARRTHRPNRSVPKNHPDFGDFESS